MNDKHTKKMPPAVGAAKGAKSETGAYTIPWTAMMSTGKHEGVDKDYLLIAALGYAEREKHVLPCNPDNKRPLVKGGYKAATTNESKIRVWWKKWPNALIGVSTGSVSNFLVLDVDRPKKPGDHDGVETLKNLEERHDPLPDTLTAKSPSGGLHFYFRPEGEEFFRCSNSQIGVKLDIKGEGGYIIVPPSPGYEWVNVVRPAPAPQWLLNLIKKSKKPPKKKRDKACTPPSRPQPDGTTAFGRAALDREVDRLSTAYEGTRNDTLNRASFALGRLVAGGEVAHSDAFDKLFQTAVAIGLDEREARATIDSGMTAGFKEPRSSRPTLPTTASGEVIPLKDIISAAFDGQHGAAVLFILLYKHRFCFDHAGSLWYIWVEHRWMTDPCGEPLAAVDRVKEIFESAHNHYSGELVLLGQTIKEVSDNDEQSKLKNSKKRLEQKETAASKQISRLNALPYRKAVVEFSAQGRLSLGISGEEWDRQPWLLPCPNGVINLRNGALEPGNPEDYLKTAAPTEYDSEAKCPRWEKALMDIFNNDKELIGFMQRVFGLSLVGEQIEHVLIVLYGSGRNGKDTILSALFHVLGPLAGPVQAELLLDQGRARSSAGPSADIMALRGRRIAWASETNEGRRMDAGRVKLLTGGGHLVGRPPFGKREISFPQSHTLFLLTNAKPHVPAEDYALWKRLHLVPFTRSFVDDPQLPHERKADKSLLDRLKGESPGILAWLVRGCLEWQQEGLTPPKVVSQATIEYRETEDLILQFVQDRCITGPTREAKPQTLYNAYTSWAHENNIKPISGTAFGRKMRERYNKKRKRISGNPADVYQGIGIVCDL